MWSVLKSSRKERTSMPEVTIIDIDLAKRVFSCTARAMTDRSSFARSFREVRRWRSLPSTRSASLPWRLTPRRMPVGAASQSVSGSNQIGRRAPSYGTDFMSKGGSGFACHHHPDRKPRDKGGGRVRSCIPTNTPESHRESLTICATEPIFLQESLN